MITNTPDPNRLVRIVNDKGGEETLVIPSTMHPREAHQIIIDTHKETKVSNASTLAMFLKRKGFSDFYIEDIPEYDMDERPF